MSTTTTPNQERAVKNSPISHPSDMPLVIIRKEYLMICGGDHCAAALLNVLEYLHRYFGRGWQERSIDDLIADLLSLYTDKKVRTALNDLEQWGFIESQQTKGTNRTKEYQMNFAVVQSLIMKAAANGWLSGSQSTTKQSPRPVRSGKDTVSSGKFTASNYIRDSLREKDSAAADADGDPEPQPQPEPPQAEDPPDITPVQESPDEKPDGEPEAVPVVSEMIKTAFRKNGKPKSERDLIYEIVCLGSFGKFYDSIGTANGHANRIVKELLIACDDLTHIEVEGAYRIYADEQIAKRQKVTDGNRLLAVEKILSRVQTYRDQQASVDTRTDDDIRAGFSPLQKLFAKHFKNETPERIDIMTEDAMLALLPENAIKELVNS